MEYLHGFPVLRTAGSRADIHAHQDHRRVVECADSGIYHNAKCASSTTSQRPEQVSVLVLVGCDYITLFKDVSKSLLEAVRGLMRYRCSDHSVLQHIIRSHTLPRPQE